MLILRLVLYSYIHFLYLYKSLEDDGLRAINKVIDTLEIDPTFRFELNHLDHYEESLTHNTEKVDGPVLYRLSVCSLFWVNEVRNCERQYVDHKLQNKEFARSFELGLDDIFDCRLQVQFAVLFLLIHHISKFKLTEFIIELTQSLINDLFVS